MSKNSKSSFKNTGDEARIDRAVRRAVGMNFALPTLRSMMRACGIYANVIAAVVALGLPTAGGLRSVAGSATLAFESAVRSARESIYGMPEMLTIPSELTEAGEIAGVGENPREERSVDSIPMPDETPSDVPEGEVPTPIDSGFSSDN